MKTILLSITAIVCSVQMQAQNKNVTNVTKTTVTTVKDSDGVKQSVKTQDIKQVQNIELQNSESNQLNKDIKQTPIQVTSTTQITNPDGSTRTVNIDRSSFYESDGKKFQLALDAQGYSIIEPTTNTKAFLRKTTTNSYIYRNKNKISIGYFDTNGNLVLETYDDKTDSVTVETFKVLR